MSYSEFCKLNTFILCCVLDVPISILGIVGNVTAFIVYGKMEQRNATTLLFRALAVTDTCLLVLATPISVLEYIVGYIYPGTVREKYLRIAYPIKYIRPLLFITQAVTIWVAVMVGVFRYIAVCKPLTASRLCTTKNARIAFISVIVFFIVFMSPMFFDHEFQTIRFFGENVTFATEKSWAKGVGYGIIYTCVIQTSVMTVIPLTFVMFITVRLVLALRAARNQRMELRVHNEPGNRITVMLVVLLAVFLVCQLPTMTKQVLRYTLPSESKGCGTIFFYFSYISDVFNVLNSAINCVIYIAFNEKFRQIICSRYRQQSGQRLTWNRGVVTYEQASTSVE